MGQTIKLQFAPSLSDLKKHCWKTGAGNHIREEKFTLELIQELLPSNLGNKSDNEGSEGSERWFHSERSLGGVRAAAAQQHLDVSSREQPQGLQAGTAPPGGAEM